MNYKISKEEKEVLLRFKKAHIPAIFKTDYIEHMLFIEDIDFNVCDFLLKGQRFSTDLYREIIINYDNFVADIDVSRLNGNAKEYYNDCLQIINILKKYMKVMK